MANFMRFDFNRGVWTNSTDGGVTFRDVTFHSTSRDLTGQVQTRSYRKSVIALCDLTNANIGANSWSSGRLSFHRYNSIVIEIWADIQIAKIYNTSTPRAELRRNSASTPRVCTFTYNGVKYGGVEFFYANAEHEHVIWNGVGNFTPFGLDYFDTQNNVALNAEVNNSLNFTEGVISQGNYVLESDGGGVVVGYPTGGAKGAGTINANAVYDDNVLLTCGPVEFMSTGGVDIEKWDSIVPGGRKHEAMHRFAKMLDEGFDPRDPAKFCARMRADGAVPGLMTEAEWRERMANGDKPDIGTMLTRTFLAIDNLAVAFAALVERVDALEKGGAGKAPATHNEDMT